MKGAYDPVTKVDLSEVPDFAEPASFKSEVHSGEILEMELPLMFSVRISSPLHPEVSDTLVPVLTRRTHFKADAEKLTKLADFQFWLRALCFSLSILNTAKKVSLVYGLTVCR